MVVEDQYFQQMERENDGERTVLLTDGISLPVRWDKTVIVVMNEVRVSSPYHPDSVVGGTPAANERVKKVLDFERKRLQLRSSSGQ
ncbi:hypothetical protein Ahy_B03g062715 isoform B [Arachis hypogaea]|uniref:AD domain-containing protein n=1 Tax=Arachis hypogaea TaxID=3818 RepID=A0A444ZVC4_ARAHY|nr:hypothetical protein Ahy_B03g062715 isoform B [Arachis hypogaea]